MYSLSYINIKIFFKKQSYDFGIGQGPGEESHGGSTYCAISSLYMLNKLDEGLLSKEKTLFWLISRQESGFQGRANKPPDTCYSFWIGASLKVNCLLFFV